MARVRYITWFVSITNPNVSYYKIQIWNLESYTIPFELRIPIEKVDCIRIPIPISRAAALNQYAKIKVVFSFKN